MSKVVEPSIKLTAFSCPHCGAFTSQEWFRMWAQRMGDGKTPFIPSAQVAKKILEEMDPEKKAHLGDWVEKLGTGLVFVQGDQSRYLDGNVGNLSLSRCYNCKKIAVWIHDRLAFPGHKTGTVPNSDLPDDIIRDFEEARGIVDQSPRGAAALLRLAIQKLCKHLGEPGKNIDDDIASLVGKGLNPLVQKSLDIVRVIGNEAVHPGVIDLNDDRDVAIQLFDLINAIADQLISHPRHVEEMYGKLPVAKRDAIDKRNLKALANAGAPASS